VSLGGKGIRTTRAPLQAKFLIKRIFVCFNATAESIYWYRSKEQSMPGMQNKAEPENC